MGASKRNNIWITKTPSEDDDFVMPGFSLGIPLTERGLRPQAYKYDIKSDFQVKQAKVDKLPEVLFGLRMI